MEKSTAESKDGGPSQLSLAGWFLEEEKKTEDTLNHMRKVMGTFRTDTDPTFNYLTGYLSGLRVMFREMENRP